MSTFRVSISIVQMRLFWIICMLGPYVLTRGGVCATRYSLCGQGLPSSYNPDTDMLLCFVPTRAWKTT